MRVRLIRPLLIGIARLDTAATKATGGYDAQFGSVKHTKDAHGRRVSARIEKPEIKIPGQVEDQTWNSLRMFNAGNSPEAKLAIVFSYHVLEELELIDEATKQPALNLNDRLVAIRSEERREERV